jgi:hypothetical protein
MPDGSTVHSALQKMVDSAGVRSQSSLPPSSFINITTCSLAAVPSVLMDQKTGFQRNAASLQKVADDLEANKSSSYTFLVVIAPHTGGPSLTLASRDLLLQLDGDPALKKVTDVM